MNCVNCNKVIFLNDVPGNQKPMFCRKYFGLKKCALLEKNEVKEINEVNLWEHRSGAKVD